MKDTNRVMMEEVEYIFSPRRRVIKGGNSYNIRLFTIFACSD